MLKAILPAGPGWLYLGLGFQGLGLKELRVFWFEGFGANRA